MRSQNENSTKLKKILSEIPSQPYILILDESMENGEVLFEILKEKNIPAICENDLSLGYQMVLGHIKAPEGSISRKLKPPSMIFMRDAMSIDGFSLCKYFRDETKQDLSIVMVTRKKEILDEKWSKRCGARELIDSLSKENIDEVLSKYMPMDLRVHYEEHEFSKIENKEKRMKARL